MKVVYRTKFPIRLLREQEDVFSSIAGACLRWAIEREEVDVSHKSLPRIGASNIAETALGNGHKLEARRVQADRRDAWVMRFEHPDQSDSDIRWIVELGLSRNGTDKPVFFCSMSVGRVNESVAPLRFYPSRPRIVATVLRDFSCGGTVRLLSKAYQISASEKDISLFRQLLEIPTRMHPVVFITPRSATGEFVATNYEELADTLGGLAHTVVATTPEATRLLGANLPAQLNCWDGAVRLYWPRFDVSQSPYSHPLWQAWQIEALNIKHPLAFSQLLLRRIASVAIFSFGEDFLSWSQLESWERVKAIEQAKAAGDIREELKLYIEDNMYLDGERKRLLTELGAKSQELETARARIAVYESAFERMKAGDSASVEEDLPITTVADAIARAEKRFADKFVFAWNSKSEIESPFDDPEEVFQAFVWLATNYFDSKTSKNSGKPLKDDIRESLDAWFYSGGQSEMTMREFKEWYQCQNGGQRVWLAEHIGTGTSKDSRESIRIAFTWDKDSKKVILGFIGQHQRNRAT